MQSTQYNAFQNLSPFTFHFKKYCLVQCFVKNYIGIFNVREYIKQEEKNNHLIITIFPTLFCYLKAPEEIAPLCCWDIFKETSQQQSILTPLHVNTAIALAPIGWRGSRNYHYADEWQQFQMTSPKETLLPAALTLPALSWKDALVSLTPGSLLLNVEI